MKQFDYPNRPLNLSALEAIEYMAGGVPLDIRDQILGAPFSDDLSGLRELGHRFVRPQPFDWEGCLQPKREIGEYVESAGIKVPRRFETLEEALRLVSQGGRIVIRSESPQEFSQFSGLLKSYGVDAELVDDEYDEVTKAIKDGRTEEEVLQIAKQDCLDWRPMKRYLQLTEQDAAEFYKTLSFSFWQHIPGRNIAVVADDAVFGRYHITAYGRARAVGAAVDESGAVFSQTDQATDSLTATMDKETIAELVTTYEKVRSLPRFSATECPIMEMQVDDDGGVWFLQYHQARPMRPTKEKLVPSDYPEQEGWVQADAVRGALGSFVTLRTGIWYPEFEEYSPKDPEDASFDLHYDIGLSEVLNPRRAAFFGTSGAKRLYHQLADGSHQLRSRWFKPVGALDIGRDWAKKLGVTDEMKEEIYRAVSHDRRMARLAIDTASDGRIGFVRLNPDSIQPIIKQE